MSTDGADPAVGEGREDGTAGEDTGEDDSVARADQPENDVDGSASHPDRGRETSGGNPGRKGWLLVAAVVLSVLVVPGLVYLFPTVLAEAGVPFLVAMLVLPFFPAVLLGAAAVWSMTGVGREAGGE